MADEREPFATPPRLIDGGRVAQVIVEYTAPGLGTRHYRGRVSRRQYVFDASPRHRQNYVLLEDADHFRLFSDFRVLEESKIDPQEDRLKAIERELAEARARLSALPDQGQDEQARPARNRGGRPAIPLREQQRLWHMRHHTLRPWSIHYLAAEFVQGDEVPSRGTISTRLARFKKSRPELLSEDVCPFCAEGYDPSPPDSR